jgi:hypothetical protein
MTKCIRKFVSQKATKLSLVLIIFATFSNASLDIKTPKSEKISSLMLVGNSFFYYNNSLHNHLGDLIKNDPNVTSMKRRSITINGSDLPWHDIESYLSNEHIGSFRIDTKNNNKYVPSSNTKIDAVIFMGCSLCPIHPDTKDTFQVYVQKYSEIIRDKNAEPMLFMSWPYKNKPEMINSLRNVFINTANKNNLLLIPAGEAFYRFNLSYPEIDLYTKDLRHPSKEGTYLAAAVVFASLYGKATAGNPGIMNLDPEVAHKIQMSVDKTVSEFMGITLK